MLIKYKLPGVDEEDDSNWTPLFWALEAPTERALSTLLNSCLVVNVNHRDHSGRTALYWTAGYGNVDKLRLLLAVEGIDAQARDRDGSTPLAYARSSGQHDTARLLEDFLGLPSVSLSLHNEKGACDLWWLLAFRQSNAAMRRSPRLHL